MIDRCRLIGNPETFQPEYLQVLLSKGIINNMANLEKAIFSLEYVGQLRQEGLDFLLKGGSAVQILLGEKWNRLSIDVDICTNVLEDGLTNILKKISLKFGDKAFTYSKRRDDVESSVPFYLYRIETPPITDKRRTILLDALGIKPRMATRRTPLKTIYYDSSIEVTTPTIGAILGDKISIIGPNTIGRPLRDSRNGLEYAKHFYDVNRLSDSQPDFRECVDAYKESIRTQSQIRNREFSLEECFKDAVFTCQVASLPQRLGRQAIENLNAPEKDRAVSEYETLGDGLRRFRPFLVQNRTYAWDNLREYASKTALLIKTIRSNLTATRIEEILHHDIPKSKEEIQKLLQRIQTVPKEQRWFIIPEEIVNFPSILKMWHDFFIED